MERRFLDFVLQTKVLMSQVQRPLERLVHLVHVTPHRVTFVT